MSSYPHQQILNATKHSPLLIAKYPMYYGSYLPHIFWHETTKKKNHVEAIYSASWNKSRVDPDTKQPSPGWNTPKLKSQHNHTICLLFLDSDPASENNGLPIIKSIQISTTTTLAEIFEFASNPNHSFDGTQKSILMQALLQHCTSASAEFIHINKLWSYYHNADIAETAGS